MPRNLTEEQKIQFCAIRVRYNDSMLDKLAAIGNEQDRCDWLNKYGSGGVAPMPPAHAEVYWKARKYMLHATVLRQNRESGSISIIPFNAFPPDHGDWSFVDMSHIDDIAKNDELIRRIYNCELLPIEQRPLESYSSKLNMPIFSDLDFDAVPVEVQPTLCILNWLRARGLDVRITETREQMEKLIDTCLRAEKPIIETPLQPVAGLHDAYRKIASRHAGNEYDTPNGDYFSVVAKLKVE